MRIPFPVPAARTAAAALGCAALLAAGAAPAEEAGWREVFKDPEDGRLDSSQWLVGRKGFLPVPLVITEPAVGYGGGLAIAFFHRDPDAASGDPGSGRRQAPPSISVVMGAATENGTRIAGAGHLGIWRDDTIRYSGFVGAMDMHLEFFGGEDFPELDQGVGYSLKGWATLQQGIWRIGRSDLWIGGQVVYFDSEAKLEANDAPPAFDALNGQIENLGAGVVLQYDTRDNILTPSAGIQSEWNLRKHWGSFVQDLDYTELDGKNRFYFGPDPKWVVALRVDTSLIGGEAPFYALPYVNQRGIPRLRYQGKAVLTTEVETRYDIDGRWFAVAFAGVGRAGDSFGDLADAESRWAGGVGGRYLIARALGLQAGLDVARGPEEWAFYLQVGSGWGF